MKILPLSVLFLLSAILRAESPIPPTAQEALRSFIGEQKEKGTIDVSKAMWKTQLPKFPEVSFRDGGRYIWEITTSEGKMTFALDHVNAPEHVRNILYLSELKFYDDLVFHRIIPGFMAQGGCPRGRGNGNPGYALKLEAKRTVKHEGAGVLSMARSRLPDSAGSQFFITFRSTPNLDGGYTVFGTITSGQEVLKLLEAAGNPDPRANGVPPKKLIKITGTTVTWEPDAAPASDD